jgi:formyl-CoA transferase
MGSSSFAFGELLRGIRVVELTSWISGPYAGAMLAALGADVIKVEPPQGDSWRDDYGYASFVAINRNKKGIVIDLRKEEGRDVLLDLARASDVFLENMAPDTIRKFRVTYDDIKQVNPRIIYGSIKGFGDGPYEDWIGTDPAAQAMSGSMMVTGYEDKPPARCLVSWIDDAAAIYMAYGVLAALMRRSLTGEGAYLEVALFDVASEFVTNNLLNEYLLTGRLPGRYGSEYPTLVPYGAFRAKDGYIFTGARNERIWREFCRILGLDDIVDDPRFRTNKDRVAHREELRRIIEDAMAKFTVDELAAKLRALGEVAVPVRTMDKLLSDPHLAHRGLLRDVLDPEHGVPVKVAKISLRTKEGYVDEVRSRAPELGEHTVEVLRDVLHYDEDRIKSLLEKGAVLANVRRR